MKERGEIRNIYRRICDLLRVEVKAPEELQLIGYMFTYPGFRKILQEFESEQKLKSEKVYLITLENKCYRINRYSFGFNPELFIVSFTLMPGSKSKFWRLRYNDEKKLWVIMVCDLLFYYVNSGFRKFLQCMAQRIKEMINEYEKVNTLYEKYNINELMIKTRLEG